MGAAHGSSEERHRNLEELIHQYWIPVYLTLRRGWNKERAEAQDLTQDFFIYLMEQDLFAAAEPERGRFRYFLKGILRKFMSDYHKWSGREKRGGDVTILKFNFDIVPEDHGPVSPAASPEAVFDRTWAMHVFDAAIEDIRRELESKGKRLYFEVFQAYDLHSGERAPQYSEIAEKLGLSETNVRHYLSHVRERLRERIRSIVAETIVDPRDVDDEVRGLLALLG